jgi:hypothetical protein
MADNPSPMSRLKSLTSSDRWIRAKQDTSGFDRWRWNLFVAILAAGVTYALSRRFGRNAADSMTDLYIAIGVIAVVFLLCPVFEFAYEYFKAPKRILANRVTKLEVELAKREQQIAAQSRDWNTEWKECGDRFAGFSAYLRADWTQHESRGNEETWRFADDLQAANFSSLANLCGEMLLASPMVQQNIPDAIRAEPNPAARWLAFLKYRGELTETNVVNEVMDDGKKFAIRIGSISNVGDASRRACIDCAAFEFRSMHQRGRGKGQ